MNTIGDIYTEYSKTVYGFLLKHTHDVHLSEELTQETFFRATKSFHTFNGKCKISTWLCQIAKHILYQEWAKVKKVDLLPLHENEKIQSISTEEIIISNENKKGIYKIINTLENPYKEVMYLRLTGELSFKDIGDILEKTENWARTVFYRGKIQVIRRLNNEK